MFNFRYFYKLISTSSLYPWLETLPAYLTKWHNKIKGHSSYWYNSVKSLPSMVPDSVDLLNSVSVYKTQFSKNKASKIKCLLKNLMPWRKGPYFIYGIHINSEWRSNWKWNRIVSHIRSLVGKKVLDIGCGNGYYIWRMIGIGAQLVVGIDHSELSFFQFEAIRKLIGNNFQGYFLPGDICLLPDLEVFDVVFYMGVLYHRRSPIDDLLKIKKQLISGGQLILETLIIKGNKHEVLVPSDRYARMNNVYFIPSIGMLKIWLKKCGFLNIRVIDCSLTTIKEQRCTEWSNNKSLAESLDPNDRTKTIEGYPSPIRALVISNKP